MAIFVLKRKLNSVVSQIEKQTTYRCSSSLNTAATRVQTLGKFKYTSAKALVSVETKFQHDFCDVGRRLVSRFSRGSIGLDGEQPVA
jgi:hypothetical protein